MRWKRFSALIVISLLGPVCGYAQSQPAQPKAPAPQQAAAPEPATQVRAFGNAPQAKPGATGASGQAQNAAAPQVDPQLKADILRLFAVMNVKTALERSAQAKLGVLQSAFSKMLPDTPHREQIAGRAAHELAVLMSSEEFEDDLVAVYAKYFNDEQTKGLIQVYQSPAWRHYEVVKGGLKEGVRQAGGQFALQSFPRIFAGLCSQYPELRGKAVYCPAAPVNAPGQKGSAPTGEK